jgi:SAM-dependent methyltransferase
MCNQVDEMGSEKKKFIAYDAWETLADAYAEQADTKPHNAYLEKPATLSLLPDVKGKRVLDAGCGSGSNSEWLIRHGAEVTAFDATPKMVGHARKRLGDAVDVRLHDLRDPLSFLGDNTIDLVLAALVMDYIEDWVPVFQEFRRVLRGDGVLVFSVGHPFIDYFQAKGSEDYFRVERVEMWWTTWGTPVLMPSYRRPLENITNALYEAGFAIERLIEAKPTLKYKEADPEGYEKVSKRPSFICIKAITLKKV